jgi:hypothetical protein
VSTCISKHGEFSSHEVDDEFTCRLCGSFDEAGALERIRRLERGGEELGKSLMFWMELARKVTDSDDVIEEDGDGDWGVVAERLAALRNTAAAGSLREAARYFEYEMAPAWGGDARWISTGSHVADLVGDVLRERAAEIEAGEPS